MAADIGTARERNRRMLGQPRGGRAAAGRPRKSARRGPVAGSGQHRADKPEHRVHVGPVIHLAGEDQRAMRHAGLRRNHAGLQKGQDSRCSAPRSHPDRRAAQRRGIGSTRPPRIGCPADGKLLVTDQFAPLDQRAAAAGQRRAAQVRQVRAALQHMVCVVVIEDEAGRAAPRLPRHVPFAISMPSI